MLTTRACTRVSQGVWLDEGMLTTRKFDLWLVRKVEMLGIYALADPERLTESVSTRFLVRSFGTYLFYFNCIFIFCGTILFLRAH